MRRLDWLIRGGTVVTATGFRPADVAVAEGRVLALGEGLSMPAREVLDVDGAYVFPGFIDAHIHPVYVDDMGDSSLCAAHGGVTTVMHFVPVEPGESLPQVLRSFVDKGTEASVLDFALHGALFDPASQAEDIPAAVGQGVTSFKLFLSYAKLNRMTDDYQLMRTLDIIASAGGMAMVHAENGLAMEYLESKFRDEGRDPAATFEATRPGILEAEAMNRAAAMAQVAGCPLYLPHVSSHEGAAAVRRLRRTGHRLYAEACPHHLTLTQQAVLDLGAPAKIGPPLRNDRDRLALWRALGAGELDVIASDHAPKDKSPGDDFSEAAYGAAQTETMPVLIYDGGVATGWLTLPRMAQLMSENQARIFGIYPQKGTLEVGSDADLVVWDPAAQWTITHGTQHSNAPYTLYEGRHVLGRPVLVMQRGETVVREGELVGRTGQGRFLATKAGKVELAELQPKGGTWPQNWKG